MYLIMEHVCLNKTIAFAYGNALTETTKADAYVEGDGSAVVVEKSITDVGSENDEHVQGV